MIRIYNFDINKVYDSKGNFNAKTTFLDINLIIPTNKKINYMDPNR